MPAATAVRHIGRSFVFGALLLGAAPAAGQNPGVLFGIVVDDRTQAPVVGARVSLLGAKERSEVDPEGVFVLTDLPVGKVQLSVEREGYSTSVEQVDISADSLSSLEVRLVPIAAVLEELLVVAHRAPSGSGSAIAEVSSDRGSSYTAADLLARVPGIAMKSSRGVAGRSSGVSLRGTMSLTRSGAPTIYLDGVRLADYASSASTDGPFASTVLTGIPAREVVRIRVIRGASAAAQYADAADGVILIETSRAAPLPR